ncbi:DUF2188 domain-containing protein [Thiolinea disciformis]|uniref:DUF2188 domain-containing protein n=1 Tax=Thiolinea disciformis TaxID=125614 RepID=UPI0003656D18|nr:DUF2188 domain-containing protein [Thiolinea disciformis]
MVDTHRVLSHEDGWCVKRDGASRASGVYETQKEAIAAGRVISRNQETELAIHKRNSVIDRRDSHGNDPYPPKG